MNKWHITITTQSVKIVCISYTMPCEKHIITPVSLPVINNRHESVHYTYIQSVCISPIFSFPVSLYVSWGDVPLSTQIIGQGRIMWYIAIYLYIYICALWKYMNFNVGHINEFDIFLRPNWYITIFSFPVSLYVPWGDVPLSTQTIG